MTGLPPLDEILACPVDGSALRCEGNEWISAAGRRYPVVSGVPVLFRPETSDTICAMAKSRMAGDSDNDPFCLDTLDMDEADRAPLQQAVREWKPGQIDPVAAWMVAATCGNLYLDLVGRLPRYPIPELRLKNGAGAIFVDLGCNWGRWCIAAAHEGFVPIGIDPQLGAVLAARRVAEQLGVKAHFICADARHLPLRAEIADVVFSYSVLQHLSRADVARAIADAKRVMKNGARLFAQMPNVLGLRCFLQWARRAFRDGTGFEVRYWTPRQLRTAFGAIGEVRLETDCFFSIGIQPADMDLMPAKWRLLARVSETLRKFARFVPGLTALADSVYVDVCKAA